MDRKEEISRLYEEHHALTVKSVELETEMGLPAFLERDETDRMLMKLQHRVLRTYRHIIHDRLRNLEKQSLDDDK